MSEIAAMLFPAYRVDNGHMHLAGCQLTDHPFLRLSFAGRRSGRVDPPRVRGARRLVGERRTGRVARARTT